MTLSRVCANLLFVRRWSTNERQKAKQPLGALSRHFKCGEEAREIWYNKREDKESEKEKQVAILVLGGLAISVPHGGSLSEGQEKKSRPWSIAWSQATVPCASRCRPLPRRPGPDQDFMHRIFKEYADIDTVIHFAASLVAGGL